MKRHSDRLDRLEASVAEITAMLMPGSVEAGHDPMSPLNGPRERARAQAQMPNAHAIAVEHFQQPLETRRAG